jgi:DNA polymerase
LGSFNPGSKILFVGEAPGENEERLKQVFVGSSGRELQSQLEDAGISRASCSFTNVFTRRPPNNDLQNWGVTRKELIIDGSRPWAYISANKLYVRPDIVQPALERLREEIKKLKPNLIVALGNTAMAALCNVSGIGKIRGTLYLSTLVQNVKVIGTYHPAAIMRQYDNRPVVIADLMKAKIECEYPELRLLRRALYLEPTINDLIQWRERLISAPALAVDCETKAEQITCVGFSPSPVEAYVIPFWDRRKPHAHYWPDAASERFAWEVCRDILSSPSIKILQNGLYDVQYFIKYQWRTCNFLEDTMIRHHSLYPGLPKGLDFLGSLYANERAWKKFRPRGGEEKREA